MEQLKEYLKKARAFNAPKCRALCIGNTSADMDSVLGSFAMAWYYGQLSGNASELLYSPVINCKFNELPFRLEIIEHLNGFGIDG